RHDAIALYDTKEGKQHLVTSGYYDDDEPVFDPDGKYLFYRSGREFSPVYSDLDDTWIYPNSTQLMAVTLRKDVPSLLSPRNDDEGEKDKKKNKDKDKEKDKAKDKKKPEEPKKDEPKLDDKKDEPKDDAKDEDSKDKKSEEKD